MIYPWKEINIVEVEKQLDLMIANQRVQITKLVACGPPYTWGNFLQPLDDMNDEMNKLWFPVSHLSDVAVPQDVVVCEAERKIFQRCLKKLSNYGTWFMQNKSLFSAHQWMHENADALDLTPPQRMALKNTLIGFRLSGVGLPAEEKKRYREINTKLSVLKKKFENNVVDSTSPRVWAKLITDITLLDGLSLDILEGLSKAAERHKQKGWLITLGDSTYEVILKNAKSRELRKEIYEARINRASSRGIVSAKRDNLLLINEIMDLRYERAKLLGYQNYAAMSLEGEMAESTEQVMNFLNEVISKALPSAIREREALAHYAKEHDGIEVLEAWDVKYYLELVKEERYAFSQEVLAEYFPAEQVVSGVFAIANRLYGITSIERSDVVLWHPDAKFFEVQDKEGRVIGGLCTDLYERPGEKNGGGWMNEMVTRRLQSDGTIQLPVGLWVLNFMPAAGDRPSLLSLSDVESSLHELGHNLNLLLTTQVDSDVSGTNGIPQDGIELPSQFMENFLWTREGIDLLARHYKTGEKIPDGLFEKVCASRTFGLGHLIVWLASRSIFDFRLHLEHDPLRGSRVEQLYREIFEFSLPVSAAYLPWAPESFTHPFCGGYDAGYYSYLWANVLAVDAFEAFLKDKKIDWSVGEIFQRELLSRGGSRPFMDSYVAFRGRKPSIEPLLRQYGFIE